MMFLIEKVRGGGARSDVLVDASNGALSSFFFSISVDLLIFLDREVNESNCHP
jgi:hypothetical protein